MSWIAPANNGAEIDYYELQYRSDDSEPWEPDGRRIAERGATIEGLENGTEYEVQVRAVNSVGESEWSASGRGTPVSSARRPDAPSAPTVTPGDGQLAVSWIAPANNGAEIEYYEVQTWLVDVGESPEDDRRIEGTSTTVTDLENGTSYVVRVRAGTRWARARGRRARRARQWPPTPTAPC